MNDCLFEETCEVKEKYKLLLKTYGTCMPCAMCIAQKVCVNANKSRVGKKAYCITVVNTVLKGMVK